MITIETEHGTVDLSYTFWNKYRRGAKRSDVIRKFEESGKGEFTLDERIRDLVDVNPMMFTKFLESEGYPIPQNSKLLEYLGDQGIDSYSDSQAAELLELLGDRGLESNPIPALAEMFFQLYPQAKESFHTPLTSRTLVAHGGQIKGEYMFADSDDNNRGRTVWTPVEDWINQHDGLYDALYIACCNPGNVMLKPRKSFIVYPSGDSTSDDILMILSEPTPFMVLPPKEYNLIPFPNNREGTKHEIMDFVREGLRIVYSQPK